jgi:phosphomevalonate kinase
LCDLGPDILLQDNGLDYSQLLNATAYKEEYRAKMITWGEEKRAQDPNFFCNKTIEMADSSKPVWIISDARRLTDVQFFRENYPDVVLFVRISASLTTRQNRGFVFTPGKMLYCFDDLCFIDHSAKHGMCFHP